jgi:hypothetical protein
MARRWVGGLGREFPKITMGTPKPIWENEAGNRVFYRHIFPAKRKKSKRKNYNGNPLSTASY